jgi:hypothetical protein
MNQIKGTKQSRVKRTESTLATKRGIRELTRGELTAQVVGGGDDNGWATGLKH